MIIQIALGIVLGFVLLAILVWFIVAIGGVGNLLKLLGGCALAVVVIFALFLAYGWAQNNQEEAWAIFLVSIIILMVKTTLPAMIETRKENMAKINAENARVRELNKPKVYTKEELKKQEKQRRKNAHWFRRAIWFTIIYIVAAFVVTFLACLYISLQK